MLGPISGCDYLKSSFYLKDTSFSPFLFILRLWHVYVCGIHIVRLKSVMMSLDFLLDLHSLRLMIYFGYLLPNVLFPISSVLCWFVKDLHVFPP